MFLICYEKNHFLESIPISFAKAPHCPPLAGGVKACGRQGGGILKLLTTPNHVSCSPPHHQTTTITIKNPEPVPSAIPVIAIPIYREKQARSKCQRFYEVSHLHVLHNGKNLFGSGLSKICIFAI